MRTSPPRTRPTASPSSCRASRRWSGKAIQRNITALLALSANRAHAAEFAGAQLRPGVTRAVVHERDRTRDYRGACRATPTPSPWTCSRNASDRARISTWRLDVTRRDAPEGGLEWAIADQIELSSVNDLYRLSLDPGQAVHRHQSDAAGRGPSTDAGRRIGLHRGDRSGRERAGDDRPRPDDFSTRRPRRRRTRSGSSAAPRCSIPGSTPRTSGSIRLTSSAWSPRRSCCRAPVDPERIQEGRPDLPRGFAEVLRPRAGRSVARCLVAAAATRRFHRRRAYAALRHADLLALLRVAEDITLFDRAGRKTIALYASRANAERNSDDQRRRHRDGGRRPVLRRALRYRCHRDAGAALD